MITDLREHMLSRRRLLQMSGSAALIAGSAALLAACTPGGSTASGTKTLKVAVFGASQSLQSRERMVGVFEGANKGVKVELIPIQGTDWNDFFTKILTQVASGNAPDVVEVSTEGAQLFADQLAAPLDDLVKRDRSEIASYFSDVHPSLIEASMYQGSLYSLPFKFNAANMVFNTSLLEKAGVEAPGADWTADDFLAAAAAISNGQGSTVSPFYWSNSLFGGLLPWMFVNDSNLLTEKRAKGGEWLWNDFYDAKTASARGGGWLWEKPIANDPANVEALEFLRELTVKGYAPAPQAGASVNVQGLFAGGSVGMAPGGGSWAGGLAAQGMTPEAFNVQYFPKWKTQRQSFGAAGYMLMNDAKDKDLAWEFIKYSVTPEAVESVASGNTTTPALRSLVTADRYATTGPENWSVFYGSLDDIPTTSPLPSPPKSNLISAEFTKYVSLGVNGDLSPKQALDQMQAALESILGA